ncbi:MAG: hypothetical protein IJR79_01395 [Clostridia bacterium]|nr:hypothetical protein [Clostridia bacterium]MBQ7751611.1 hypothetical protein [Clostridia bacterium]
MDIFREQIVERKKNTKDMAIIAGIVALTLLLSFVLISIAGALAFLLLCGLWYGAWRLITGKNIEYEYIITDTILDIDKIIAKRSRKRILSIDLADAERFMPISDMPNIDVKTVDATPNGIEDGVYGVDFSSNAQMQRLLFKPDKKFLNSAKMARPSLVVLKREDIEE